MLDFMGTCTFCCAKSIKAMAVEKLNVFTFYYVYPSIRISFSMHLVIFVVATFHLNTSKMIFLAFFITLR